MAEPSPRWDEPERQRGLEGSRRFETVTSDVRPEGRPWTIGSFILAVIGVFILPVVAGAIGAVVGWAGLRRGDPLARWAIGANLVIVALGVIAAIVLVS